MRAVGGAPRKCLGRRHFNLRKTTLLYKEDTAKRHFHCFAEKSKGPDPQEPLVARLEGSSSHQEVLTTILFCHSFKNKLYDTASQIGGAQNETSKYSTFRPSLRQKQLIFLGM